MHQSDAELLTAAAAGDGDAFAAFFRAHVRSVTVYAVRRCSTPDEVADLVAETFLAALSAAERYRPEHESALPWLFGIARHILLRQRRRTVGRRRLQEKAGNVLPSFIGSEEEAVASAIDASRQAPHLKRALLRLSAGEREVLELVAYEGLSPQEAASVLGVTPNAARLRLSRARRRMRTELAALTPAIGYGGSREA